jgi:uncharacterized protein YacL
MWLLDWLPFWIFHLIVLAGILGLLVAQFIKFIPLVTQYRLILQIGSIAVLALGLYMEGGISNQKKWEARVKEMELKIAEAENHSREENVKIETKVITKTKIIKERGEDIIKIIDREITKYDNTCVIPKEFIKIHNAAAEAPK